MMTALQNVFDHCAQTLRRRKLKLGDFQYLSIEHRKEFLLLPRLSGVTIATSLLGSTRDFLKLLFHMFLYNEISKVLKSKI